MRKHVMGTIYEDMKGCGKYLVIPARSDLESFILVFLHSLSHYINPILSLVNWLLITKFTELGFPIMISTIPSYHNLPSLSFLSSRLQFHQQNLPWAAAHIQCSNILQSAEAVFLSHSKYSQTHLRLDKLLWDAARPCSDSADSTSINWGACKILWSLRYMIVRFRSSYDHCTSVQQIMRGAETFVQVCIRL